MLAAVPRSTPSRVAVCQGELEELQAGRVHFQEAGATAALLHPAHRQVAGLLLDRAVLGGPQHAVCGRGALRPARAALGFSK